MYDGQSIYATCTFAVADVIDGWEEWDNPLVEMEVDETGQSMDVDAKEESPKRHAGHEHTHVQSKSEKARK